MREDVVDVMTINRDNDKELIQPFMRHTYNVNVMLSTQSTPHSDFQLPTPHPNPHTIHAPLPTHHRPHTPA